MIACAWLRPSVWALVVGGLVGAVAQVLLSHWILPGPRDRFGWDRDAARDLFAFGKWIFVSTLFTFLALRIDVAMLGKLLPIGALGVYSIGIMLPGILGQLSGRLIQMVLMPALSESYRGGEALMRRNFARARGVLLPVAVLSLLGLTLLAPPFFHYLYDERYRDAGWIAQLSMLPVWFTFLQESAGRVLLARGDARAWASSNVWKTVATALACWLGFRAGGLPGLILGASAGAACGYGLVAARLAWSGVPTLRQDAAWTLCGLALAALAVPGAAALAAFLGLPAEPWPRLALGAALLAPFAAYLLRGAWRGLRDPSLLP
jgi:O-antigen/teichoic acid export membrane protein